MTRKSLPARERLARLFRYDAASGRLLWRTRSDMRPEWNTRYAGRAAGSDCGHGYLKVSIRKRLFYVHHIVWVLAGRELPDEIDHINGDRADNRLSNLRAATRSQNSRNRSLQKNSTSKIKGVFPLPSGAYCARIGYLGEDHYLGSFPTKRLAAAAYAGAARRLHRDFAQKSAMSPSSC